jgi:SPP1 family predicted phage head-tail adaptor
MQVGKLNRRIKIQAQSTTSELDAFQQPTPAAWNTVYSCWAAINDRGSRLVSSAIVMMSNVTHAITIRYTSSVVFTSKQRVIYIEPTTGVTHTYNIEAVLNTKAGDREIVLMVYELSESE